jgi:hypothetical protein
MKPAPDRVATNRKSAGASFTTAPWVSKMLWYLLLLLSSAAEGAVVALLFLNQSIDRQDVRRERAEIPCPLSLPSPQGPAASRSVRPGDDGHHSQSDSGQAVSASSASRAADIRSADRLCPRTAARGDMPGSGPPREPSLSEQALFPMQEVRQVQ